MRTVLLDHKSLLAREDPVNSSPWMSFITEVKELQKMRKSERLLEREFEEAVKASGRYLDLTKPYMRETDAGYDSAFTQHFFDGYKLGKNYKENI